MSNAGYTLVEMLAALAMIGLAIGGLLEATHVIGRLEAAGGHAISDERTSTLLQERLTRLVAGQGPFFSDGVDGLTGAADHFQFPCGARSCGANLARSEGHWRIQIITADGRQSQFDVPGANEPQFTYAGERSSSDAWPVADTRHEQLRRIALIVGDGTNPSPLASIRLWIDEPRECVFDTVAQGCRK